MPQAVLLIAGARDPLPLGAARALRRAGHVVYTESADTLAELEAAIARHDFSLLICSRPLTPVPTQITRRWPTVVIQAGPPGEHEHDALDRALLHGVRTWGVTAVSASEGPGTGAIWAYRQFELPPTRKSDIYSTVVVGAAVECIVETADKASDPHFNPAPQQLPSRTTTPAHSRPASLRDRRVNWNADIDTIVRQIRASDGDPGAPAILAGQTVRVFDVLQGRESPVRAAPGTIIGRRHHTIEIACGTGTIRVGHLLVENGFLPPVKAPAVQALARAGLAMHAIPLRVDTAWDDIRYRRDDLVGVIEFDAYNGAFTADFCLRLAAAVKHASAQSTQVLVLRGTGSIFGNGSHFGAIELADDPALEGLRTAEAMSALCEGILTCQQLTLAAIQGNAAAGGLMLALTADLVVASERAILTPHYRHTGLSGAEFHSLTLPRRVGSVMADKLLGDGQSIDSETALDIGLIDETRPASQFARWVDHLAHLYTQTALREAVLAAKAQFWSRTRKPLRAAAAQELGVLVAELFDSDQHSARRRALTHKIVDPTWIPPLDDQAPGHQTFPLAG